MYLASRIYFTAHIVSFFNPVSFLSFISDCFYCYIFIIFFLPCLCSLLILFFITDIYFSSGLFFITSMCLFNSLMLYFIFLNFYNVVVIDVLMLSSIFSIWFHEFDFIDWFFFPSWWVIISCFFASLVIFYWMPDFVNFTLLVFR